MDPQSASLPAVLPTSLQANPRIGQWLDFGVEGTVGVRSGKVELGQGIHTALAQIVAEGLGLAPAQVRMLPVSTADSPNEGMTSGSYSVQHSGSALRHLCAQVRALQQRDGRSYWQLARAGAWDGDASAASADGGGAGGAEDHSVWVGRDSPRLDLPAKLRGEPVFLHDLRLPGMLFGRVLHRPRIGAQLADVDLPRARAVPGVLQVLRDGDWVGVVAETEWAAVQAQERLLASAHWQGAEIAVHPGALPEFLCNAPAETSLIGAQGDPPAAATAAPAESAAIHLHARYTRPYIAHASLAPSCAAALWNAGRLKVWSHTQGIFNLRADLALVLGVAVSHIEVEHVQGAGCYGHNGADDVACDAALLARACPGQPVLVQWTRQQELGVAPLGPAMLVELEANVDNHGKLLNWEHSVWSNGHGLRPGRGQTPVLLAATEVAGGVPQPVSVNVPMASGGGSERNALPGYAFPRWRAVNHRLLAMPLRTSALRALGAFCNVFAAESFLDEAACAAGVDPLDMRLRHTADPRARAVLERVAQMAAWPQRRQLPEGHGLGLACARYKHNGAYCAVAARVDASGAALCVQQIYVAVDVGRVVNPDGVKNQIEGGAVQATSWTLLEQVAFGAEGVSSVDWETYPILRFSQVPEVVVEIVEPAAAAADWLGAGEAAQGPTAAAIANALCDVVGVRVRDLPLTSERIRQAALA